MFTRSELLEKINLGEDNFLELKEVRFSGGKIRGPKQNELADEIAAFANTRGGILLLGVNDKTHEILGIPEERLEAVEALALQASLDSLNPPGSPVIDIIRFPDSDGVERPIVRVEIPPSLFIHQSPGGYFHRVGSSKRLMPSDYLARLFQQRSLARLVRFDELPVPLANFDDLDETLWSRFMTSRTTDTREQLLSKLAMATQSSDGVWRPTVAGMLLASTKPQQFLPGAFIQAVAYRGKKIDTQSRSVYQRDARDITGPLDQQIFDACDFIRKNMVISARKTPAGGREDLPQFDMLAVFEAVTNAVAHRDYSISGSKVRLRLFDDRLDLYTPGSMINTMTPETLPHRQATRNETVTSLLARCPVKEDDFKHHRAYIMDKRGEGVPIILSRSEQLSGKLPEYRVIDESELILTIYAAVTSSSGTETDVVVD